MSTKCVFVPIYDHLFVHGFVSVELRDALMHNFILLECKTFLIGIDQSIALTPSATYATRAIIARSSDADISILI